MTEAQLRIQEFAKTGSGGTPARKQEDRYYGGAIPWVKSGELRDDELSTTSETITEAALKESAAKLLEPGCVLIALYGATVGRTALLMTRAATNQAVCYIRPNEQVALSRYVWYALRNNIGSFLRQRVGGAQPNISQGVIKETQIPIRALSEQQRIVEILDQADALRKQRAETDAKVQRILPALFYKMFGDPADNPKGWPPMRMQELFAIPPNYGTMIPPKKEDGGNWLSLRVANISNGKLDLKDRRYVDLPANMIKRHGVLEGDLLLARAIGSLDHLGKCFIAYPPKGEQWAFDSHLMRVRFNRDLVEPEMIRGFLTSPGGRTLFLSKTRKSAVQFNINTKEFASIEIPLPPIELQREYVARVADVEQIESRTKASGEKLGCLFEVLLHRALTGELTAKWREKHKAKLKVEMAEQLKILEQAKAPTSKRVRVMAKKELPNNDFVSVSPSLLKLHRDMERISQSLRPSYVNFYEEMERTLRPIRQYQQEFARMAATSDLISGRIVEVFKANQHWQSMIEQATASRRMFADLSRVHETWTKNLKPMQDQIAQLQAATKLSLGGIAFRLTVSERLFASLDFEAIRRTIALPEPTMRTLRDSISQMTATYGSLAESMRTYPDITQLPDFALPGATRELFVTGHAVDVFRVVDEPDEDEEASQFQLVTEVESETSVCIRLLQTLDPGLATPYIGAREALRGENPDRVRHILSSLRELWNHLLRRIAPDEQVLAWVPSDRKELLHEGRPTRKTRVLYVCRNLNHAPLTDFIDQDTRALMKLVEFFNRVHELESGLTDDQLRALLLRTDSWLTYILQIWEGSK